MSDIISINQLANYSSNTFNSISNRITDLYTNDITFQQNVTVNNDLTVSGNLTVDGTTTSINTDSYTTEILEIVSTNVNDDKPVLKVVESGSVGNIIEVYKGNDQVFLIDNSGAITTTGIINGASPTELSQLAGIGSTTIATQLSNKQGTLSSETDVTVKHLTATGNVNAAKGITIVSDTTGTGVGRGLRFHDSSIHWAMYMTPSGANNSPSGGVTPPGHGFDDWAIRLRTGYSTTQGFIVENGSGSNNFSVRGSDGLGYLRGGLVTDGNMSVATGKTIVNNASDTGVDRGIRFWEATNNGWAMYMSTSGAGKAPDGGTATTGHGFSTHAIRVRISNSATQGFIVENNSDSNNFSVRGSDGLGYLRGGLVTDGNMSVATGKTIVNNASDTGVDRGIRFWEATNNGWAMYMSTSGAGKASNSGTAPAGYGFTGHAIRIITGGSISSEGFIVENVSGLNNFSVRGSDGLGYLRGGLVTDGNVTVNGNITATGNITTSGMVNSTSTSFRLGYDSQRGLEHVWNYVTGTGRSAFFNWREGGSGGFDFKVKDTSGTDIGYAGLHIGGLTADSNVTVNGTFHCKSNGFRFVNDNSQTNMNGVEAVWNYGESPWGDTTFFNYIGGGDYGGFAFKNKDKTGTDVGFANLYIGGLETNSNVTVKGDITATGNITAYYSDERLKTKISDIVDPLEKIEKLNGFYYKPNELAHSLGVKHTDVEIGLSAQDVQKVLPEIIRLSPLDCDYKNNEQISKSGENYLTLSYERIVPLLVEAIKDLNKNNKLLLEEINSIKQKIDLN
jgi:hypothetical protein